MVAGGGGRVKKCVLRACLFSPWKGPVELTSGTRQEMNVCEKNQQHIPWNQVLHVPPN